MAWGAAKLTTGSLAANGIADIVWNTGASGTGRAYDCSVPCAPGETWEAQFCYYPGFGSIECLLLFVNASGAITASPTTGQQTFAPTTPPHPLSDWQTISVRGVAPAGTVAVGLLVRLRNNTSNAAACSAYVSRTLLGRTAPNATQAMPWTPGGIVSITGGIIRSNAITTRHMVAGSVKAQTIDAGAVTAEKLAVGNSSTRLRTPASPSPPMAGPLDRRQVARARSQVAPARSRPMPRLTA